MSTFGHESRIRSRSSNGFILVLLCLGAMMIQSGGGHLFGDPARIQDDQEQDQDQNQQIFRQHAADRQLHPSWSSIRPLPGEVICIRGGTLLVRLRADAPVKDWPSMLPVRFGQEQIVPGRVGWFVPRLPERALSWTSASNPTNVLGSQPAYVSSAAQPILVADIPSDQFDPVVHVNEFKLPIRLINPLPDVPVFDETLERARAENLPDPDSAFSQFRWDLLAHQLQMNPPDPAGDHVQQSVARHVSDLWRYGLLRVAQASPGVAAELRELLVSTVSDATGTGDTRMVAAWIADPAELQTVLRYMLDSNRTSAEVMNTVLSWMEHRQPLLYWPEFIAGTTVQVAVANPTLDQRLVHAQWLDGGGQSDPILVPPRSIRRLSIRRPMASRTTALAKADLIQRSRELLIESEEHRFRLMIGPPLFQVLPPGFSMTHFGPPLTLVQLQMGMRSSAPRSLQTSAILRLRSGAWELFFQCDTASQQDGQINSSGPDSVTVWLGPPQNPSHVLRVDSKGAVSVLHGNRQPPLQVHVQAFPGQWRCRIVLPDSWMLASEVMIEGSPATLIGLSRHAAGFGRLLAGPACVPWQVEPPIMAFDLGAWMTPGESLEP